MTYGEVALFGCDGLVSDPRHSSSVSSAVIILVVDAGYRFRPHFLIQHHVGIRADEQGYGGSRYGRRFALPLR